MPVAYDLYRRLGFEERRGNPDIDGAVAMVLPLGMNASVPLTPAQIARVEATWRAACRRRAEIHAAIADSLPPGTMDVDARADWIMETVDRLAPLLVSPSQLCVTAKAMAEQRGSVTTADLLADRDAILEALHHVLGSQSEQTLIAWHQAFGLFADIVAAFIVNPFCG